jgi:hypothetical protein
VEPDAGGRTRTVHSPSMLPRQIMPSTAIAPTTLCTPPSPFSSRSQSNSVHSIPYSSVRGVMR